MDLKGDKKGVYFKHKNIYLKIFPKIIKIVHLLLLKMSKKIKGHSSKLYFN